MTITIRDSNKLIAEFMDLCLDDNFYQLKYHKSFDKLMQVIDKIENMSVNNMGISVQIEKNSCTIYGNFPTISADNDTKLGATWEAIVKFIIWWNKNKHKITCVNSK